MKSVHKQNSEKKYVIFSGRLEKIIFYIQTAWSRWMNKKVNRLPGNVVKVIIIVFVCSCTIFCLHLILFSHKGKLDSGSITSPTVIQAGKSPQQRAPLEGGKMHKKLIHFLKYMDSLSSDQNGRKIFDSIMNRHPGLHDSARILEMIYQTKK